MTKEKIAEYRSIIKFNSSGLALIICSLCDALEQTQAESELQKVAIVMQGEEFNKLQSEYIQYQSNSAKEILRLIEENQRYRQALEEMGGFKAKMLPRSEMARIAKRALEESE